MAYIGKITIQNIHLAFKQLLNILQRPSWQDPTTKGIKSVTTVTGVTAVTTVTTVATVTTVTGITNIGAVSAYGNLIFQTQRNNWANSIRIKIT